MKKIKKMSKGMGAILTLVIIGAVITGAVLISYYASIQAKTDATQVLEYSEDHTVWQDAEGLSKSINLTGSKQIMARPFSMTLRWRSITS